MPLISSGKIYPCLEEFVMAVEQSDGNTCSSVPLDVEPDVVSSLQKPAEALPLPQLSATAIGPLWQHQSVLDGAKGRSEQDELVSTFDSCLQDLVIGQYVRGMVSTSSQAYVSDTWSSILGWAFPLQRGYSLGFEWRKNETGRCPVDMFVKRNNALLLPADPKNEARFCFIQCRSAMGDKIEGDDWEEGRRDVEAYIQAAVQSGRASLADDLFGIIAVGHHVAFCAFDHHQLTLSPLREPLEKLDLQRNSSTIIRDLLLIQRVDKAG